MTISTLTKDEREILLRLCDDLAAKVSPLYKQAHLVLKGALNSSQPKQPKCGTEELYRRIKTEISLKACT